MGKHRSRSRSRTPLRSRRNRHEDFHPRHSHRHYRRQSPPPCGLLVRNIALDTRPEDLKIPFEKYGPVKDVYLPKNYYTGEPRGFAFVKFRFPEDAAEAKDRLNNKVVGGREIRIVYAEENRKTPKEMRMSTHISDRYERRRRRSPSPRRRYHSYSRSPAKGRRHSRSVSRSHSPRHEKYRRSRDRSPDEREDRTRRFQNSRKTSPDNGKGYKSTGRSRSSTERSNDDDYRMSRRSPNSREISPHHSKQLKSSGRSVSPRKDSPVIKEGKAKQRDPISREVSSPDDDYKSNKCNSSPRETAVQFDRKVNSSPKISGMDDPSYSDYEKSQSLKHRSKSPEKNGGSPLWEGDLASNSMVSSKMNVVSVSPTR